MIRTPSLPGSSTCVRDGGAAARASEFPAPECSVPQAVSNRAVVASADKGKAGLRIRSPHQGMNLTHVVEAIIPVTGVSQARRCLRGE